MGQRLRPAFKVCALPSVGKTNSAQPDQTFYSRFTSTPAKCPLVLAKNYSDASCPRPPQSMGQDDKLFRSGPLTTSTTDGPRGVMCRAGDPNCDYGSEHPLSLCSLCTRVVQAVALVYDAPRDS